MSAKIYRPDDRFRVSVNTDILSDNPQRRAREELIPAMAKRSSNAVNTVPVWVEFFQRLEAGRRCSCWDIEEDPQNQCLCCYGCGIVSGFSKRGTKTITFDVTYPNVQAANIQIDYKHPSRPLFWVLADTSVYGTLEFTIPLITNIGMVDVFDIKDYTPPGTHISYLIKTQYETEWVEMNISNITERLHNDLLQCKIIMKIFKKDRWKHL